MHISRIDDRDMVETNMYNKLCQEGKHGKDPHHPNSLTQVTETLTVTNVKKI